MFVHDKVPLHSAPYNMTKEKETKNESKFITPVDKPPVKIVIGEEVMEAEYRQFKSGKKGYGSYGVIKVNGWPCRLSLNLIEM